MRGPTLVLVFPLLCATQGCISSNPAHCANNVPHDAFCAENYPGQPYCDLCDKKTLGCHAEPAADAACQANDSGTTDTTGPTTTNGPTTLTDPTTDPTDTTGPACTMDGLADPACPDETPYCVAGVCTDCTGAGGDTFCADHDGGGTPACDAGSGLCVECTMDSSIACEGNTPVCGEDNACRACVEHDECPDTACHLEVGGCLEGPVWYVRSTNCGPAGTMSEPLCTVDEAVGKFGPDETGTIKILNSATYGQRVDLSGGQTVALLGGDATLSVNDGNPIVSASGNSTLYVDQLTVELNGSGQGVGSNGSTLYLYRTVVRRNSLGGVDVSNGGNFVARNSAIAENGGAASPVSGLSVGGGAEVLISYTTIAGNQGMAQDSIVCSGASGEVRNSIVTGESFSSIDCLGVTFENNAVDENGLGASNKNVMENDVSWFVDFLLGNYHLDPGPAMVLGGVAEWTSDDLPTDIDGDPRPMGELGFPGFDEPQ